MQSWNLENRRNQHFTKPIFASQSLCRVNSPAFLLFWGLSSPFFSSSPPSPIFLPSSFWGSFITCLHFTLYLPLVSLIPTLIFLSPDFLFVFLSLFFFLNLAKCFSYYQLRFYLCFISWEAFIWFFGKFLLLPLIEMWFRNQDREQLMVFIFNNIILRTDSFHFESKYLLYDILG